MTGGARARHASARVAALLAPGAAALATLRVAALLAVLVSCVSSGASAQVFDVRLERGEIGVDGRGLYQSSGVAPGAVTSDYRQWLRVPVSGFVVHPRVLRYTLSVRPLFGQRVASTPGQGNRTRSLGLDASATAFSGRRLTLSFQATRSSGVNRGDLGAYSEFDNEGITAAARIRDRYFPTTLTFSDRSVRDRWESPFASEPIQRDQRSSRLRLEVRNRRLTTVAEQTRYRDRRGTGDHDALRAQARHRIGWGKGSSLTSTLNLYRRVGTSPIQRTSWTERALIAHTRTLGTALSFSRQGWSRGSTRGRNVAYDVTTRYNPRLELEAALSVTGQRFTTDAQEDGLYRFRVAPSARYVLRLPADARLSLSGSVGAEQLSRTLPSDLLLDVVEEPHQVDADLAFALDQLRVEPGSIEVWNEDRTLILVEGIDYRIIEAGGLVEIQILPGSRVGEGETVLVNYRYRTLAVEDTSLVFLNYETIFRLRGLSLRHGRRQRSEDVTGTTGAVAAPDEIDLWYGASYMLRTPLGGISADANRRSRDAAEIEYVSDEYRVQVDPPPLGSANIRFRWSTAKTVAGEQVTRTRSAGGSLNWPVSRSVTISGGLDGWSWGRRGQETERFLAGHAMLTWRFGQVNTMLTFDQVRRSNGLARAENRWSVRVVRRF